MFVYAKSLEIYFEFFITIVDRYENLMIQIRYYTTLHHIFKCSFSMLVIGMYRTVFFYCLLQLFLSFDKFLLWCTYEL